MRKIGRIKERAGIELSKSDWMVLRHSEETDLGIPTSLTSEEYLKLLKDRKEIRNRSNSLELIADKLTDINEVRNLKWDSDLEN